MIQGKLGDFLYFDNKLVECIGVIDGRKVLVLRPVHPTSCATCGNVEQIHVVEESLQFQQGAKAISTITGTK